MRADLADHPFVREFITVSRKVTYNGSDRTIFKYFHEDHDHLQSLMTVMIHYGAIYDIAFNSVPRFNFHEDFTDYLSGPWTPNLPGSR